MSSPPPSGAVVAPTTLSSTSNDLDLFTKLFIAFLLLTLFIRLCCVYVSMRRHSRGDTMLILTHQNQNQPTGLPIDVINSYDTFPYSNINVETNDDHETTCSICIEDYKDSEMLRMMPQCRHYFHRDCVDVWLKDNASCPVCRNSLVEASEKNNNDASALDNI